MLASFLACSVLLSSFLKTSTVSSKSLLSWSFSFSFSSSALSSSRRPDPNKARQFLKFDFQQLTHFWVTHIKNKHLYVGIETAPLAETNLQCHCSSVVFLRGVIGSPPLSLPIVQPPWRRQKQNFNYSYKTFNSHCWSKLSEDKYKQCNMLIWLLLLLQLECFMVLPQSVVLFDERDVSHLQLLQHPLALTEPAQENNLLHNLQDCIHYGCAIYRNRQYTYLCLHMFYIDW